MLSPELLPDEAALFISGLGTLLANSKAFSRADLLFGVSDLLLTVLVDIDACTQKFWLIALQLIC